MTMYRGLKDTWMSSRVGQTRFQLRFSLVKLWKLSRPNQPESKLPVHRMQSGSWR